MPRRKRSPSRSRCARRSRRQDKTAALVTPDRALARRVRRRAGALAGRGRRFRRRRARRHAGRPLRAARGAKPRSAGCEPVTLLALLKHPLLRLGAAAGAHNAAIAALERALLRGPRPRPGSDGARARARRPSAPTATTLHRSDPRWLIADDELDAAAALDRPARRRAGAAGNIEAAAIMPLADLAALPPRRDRRARQRRRRRDRRLRRPRRHRARRRASTS